MMIDAKNLTEMSNAVRATALRALRRAKSGHIGIALGAADIITMIYAVFLNPAAYVLLLLLFLPDDA